MSPDTPAFPSYPSVASDAAGNFVVVWNSNAFFAGAVVSGRRYSSTGAPLGAPFRVSTGPFAIQSRPAVASERSPRVRLPRERDDDERPARPPVALLGTGGIVVTWRSIDQDGSFSGVYAQRYACGVAGDVNGNGTVAVTDVFYLINYLFAGGPPPL